MWYSSSWCSLKVSFDVYSASHFLFGNHMHRTLDNFLHIVMSHTYLHLSAFHSHSPGPATGMCVWMKAQNTGRLWQFKWTTSCNPRIVVPEQLSGNSLSGHSRCVWLAFFCINQIKIVRNMQCTWMPIKTLKIPDHKKHLNTLPLHYRWAVPIISAFFLTFATCFNIMNII